MKSLIIIFSASFFLTSCSSSQNMMQSDYQPGYEAQQQPLTYDVFYNNLSPYGRWTSYAGYGNVWIPYAGAGFRPYETNGHWVSTNTGWAWVSNYNWGWAPFHYGRWFYEPAVGGWAWVPGYDWAPAWVQWGRYNDYYAWAPMAPGAGYGWNVPYNYWSMAPCNNITRTDIQRYIVRNQVTPQTTGNITPINNYNGSGSNNYNQGPSNKEVAEVTGHPVKTVTVKPVNTVGTTKVKSDQLEVYRPEQVQSLRSEDPVPMFGKQAIKRNTGDQSAGKGQVTVGGRTNTETLRQQPAPNVNNNRRVIVHESAEVDVRANRKQQINAQRKEVIVVPPPVQRSVTPPPVMVRPQPRIAPQERFQRQDRRVRS